MTRRTRPVTSSEAGEYIRRTRPFELAANGRITDKS